MGQPSKLRPGSQSGITHLSKPSSLLPCRGQRAVALLGITHVIVNNWNRGPGGFQSPDGARPCPPPSLTIGPRAGPGRATHSAGRQRWAGSRQPGSPQACPCEPTPPPSAGSWVPSTRCGDSPPRPAPSPQPLTFDGQDDGPHHHDERLQGVRVDHSSQAPCGEKRGSSREEGRRPHSTCPLPSHGPSPGPAEPAPHLPFVPPPASRMRGAPCPTPAGAPNLRWCTGP